MRQLEKDEIIRGKIEYAAVIPNKKGQWQMEIKVAVTEKVLGSMPGAPAEAIPADEVLTYLHLDEDGDNEGKRRSVSRDQLNRITGVELTPDWEGPNSFLRLLEDHPESLIPKIEGATVSVIGTVAKGDPTKVFANLFWLRTKPKALTMAEVKAKFAGSPY